MTKTQAIGGTVVVFALMAANSAAACDLDGVAGPHRYNPFQNVATTATAPAVPSRPAARERSTAPRERARDNRSNGGRRSDDGQGYSTTYSASTSDTSDGSGTPGDADWIHSARDR